MNIEYIIYPLIVLFLIVFLGTLGMFIYKFMKKED